MTVWFFSLLPFPPPFPNSLQLLGQKGKALQLRPTESGYYMRTTFICNIHLFLFIISITTITYITISKNLSPREVFHLVPVTAFGSIFLLQLWFSPVRFQLIWGWATPGNVCRIIYDLLHVNYVSLLISLASF